MFWLALPLTILVYFGFKKLYSRLAWPCLNPVLLSMLSLIGLHLVFELPYEPYAEGAYPLTWLLEPAVVALAVPLYLQASQIRKQLGPILLACSVGVTLSLLIVIPLAWAMGGDAALMASLAPQSVTTPVAMSITDSIGGIPALTAAVVILVGILGAAFGLPWLRLVGVTDPQAQGLAMGCAAHALGTARAIEQSERHGAYSSLALILSALLMALIAPIIFSLYMLFLT
ncbi:LrgB family protein [Motilimonas eburnea]|uniref:LrgB family protein n=1 Tax=Motilimonas eburnea TaxID=1737488 RepID=UPI001E42412D|nr:LrgB family protein [Motilimonas eburnea]MCE2571976.1 LrgB family protein [Motilimonas eburnea]